MFCPAVYHARIVLEFSFQNTIPALATVLFLAFASEHYSCWHHIVGIYLAPPQCRVLYANSAVRCLRHTSSADTVAFCLVYAWLQTDSGLHYPQMIFYPAFKEFMFWYMNFDRFTHTLVSRARYNYSNWSNL